MSWNSFMLPVIFPFGPNFSTIPLAALAISSLFFKGLVKIKLSRNIAGPK